MKSNLHNILPSVKWLSIQSATEAKRTERTERNGMEWERKGNKGERNHTNRGKWWP